MSQSPRGTAPAATPSWPGFAFAGTILLSAFLLFQVQPLISKFILPWFGGCPAVWTTCMLFFQIVLFAGYSYAHLVGSRMTFAPAGHCSRSSILLAAVALLPIIPERRAGNRPAASRRRGGFCCCLAATVGLPYFVLSTTSPLRSGLVQPQLSGPLALPAVRPVELRLAGGAAELSVRVRAGVRSARAIVAVVGRVSRLMCFCAGRARRGFGESARAASPAAGGTQYEQRANRRAIAVCRASVGCIARFGSSCRPALR